MVKEAMALRAVVAVGRPFPPPHTTALALAARVTRRKWSITNKVIMTETRMTGREKRANRRDMRALVLDTWIGTCRKREEVELCQQT